MMNGINDAFVMLYWILVGIMVAALAVTCVLSFFGVLRYSYVASAQSVSARINRSPVMSDTFEYGSIYSSYLSQARANDPYLLYTQNDILNAVFYVLAIVIMLIGLQVGITLAASVYTIFHSDAPIDVEFRLPYELLLLLVLATITAILVTWTSMTLFTKRVGKNLADAKTRVDAFNAFVFDNLYNNPVFLAKLAGDDAEGALLVLKETDLMPDALIHGIFTINMWQYFRNRLPDANPLWESVKQLFTVDAINARTMDITPFVSYSLYSSVPNGLYNDAGQLPVSADVVDTVTDTVQMLMSRVNRLMHNLEPSSISSSFLTFLVVRTVVLGVALCGLTFLFWGKVAAWRQPEQEPMLVVETPVAPAPAPAPAPALPTPLALTGIAEPATGMVNLAQAATSPAAAATAATGMANLAQAATSPAAASALSGLANAAPGLAKWATRFMGK